MTHRTATWLCLCAGAIGIPVAAAGPEDPPDEREPVKAAPADDRDLQGQLVVDAPESISVEQLGHGWMGPARDDGGSAGREEGATIQSGSVWFNDPNRTRYFVARSAMMLHGGEGYLSQKEVAATAIVYGLTDNIEVQIGAAFPAWLISPPNGIHFAGGLKGGLQVVPNFHLALEAEVLVLPATSGFNGGGVALGTSTIGTRDMHVSVSAGGLVPFSTSPSPVGNVIIVVSGSVRIVPNLAIMTENWFFPAAPSPYSSSYSSEPWLFDCVGIRIMGDQWAVDIGAVHVPGTWVPLPWLDVTWNFAL